MQHVVFFAAFGNLALLRPDLLARRRIDAVLELQYRVNAHSSEYQGVSMPGSAGCGSS